MNPLTIVAYHTYRMFCLRLVAFTPLHHDCHYTFINLRHVARPRLCQSRSQLSNSSVLPPHPLPSAASSTVRGSSHYPSLTRRARPRFHGDTCARNTLALSNPAAHTKWTMAA